MQRKLELESAVTIALARALAELRYAEDLMRAALPPNYWIDLGTTKATSELQRVQAEWNIRTARKSAER
jgi:hypothetical protein